MKALNLILITSGKISKATAHIWVVSISGDNTSRVYCKSPYKAMRYAFLLKKRTGLNISDNCLCRVSHEIARSKAPATAPEGSAPAPMQPASAAPTTTPKRTRKPAAKRTTRKRASATAWSWKKGSPAKKVKAVRSFP